MVLGKTQKFLPDTILGFSQHEEDWQDALKFVESLQKQIKDQQSMDKQLIEAQRLASHVSHPYVLALLLMTPRTKRSLALQKPQIDIPFQVGDPVGAFCDLEKKRFIYTTKNHCTGDFISTGSDPNMVRHSTNHQNPQTSPS